MPRDNKPKIGYVMRKVVLNRHNIGEFLSDEEHRRQIREGRVEDFLAMLRNGEHFQAPFVINRVRPNMARITDGNHRFESIRRRILEDPNFEIAIWMAEYRGLNPTQEKEVFNTWNSGLKQGTDDWIKIWWDTFPAGEELLVRLPASIYGSGSRIKARHIAGSHIEAKRPGNFSGGYSASGATAVRDMQAINHDDVATMAAFMRDYGQAIGTYRKTELLWKTTALQAAYKVWYDNHTLVPRPRIIAALRRQLCRGAAGTYRTLAKSGGREATKAYYATLLTALNLGRVRFAGQTNGHAQAVPEETDPETA